MEAVFSLMAGLGLSAACGFRIFVPLTIMSLLAQLGWYQLSPELAWAASPLALSGLLLATVLEIGAYYVPWLDNLLDAIATPAAIGAGTLLTFGFVPGLDPFAQWSLALIAGGGLAGTIQASTVAARATSTATTGGLGNFVVATGEAFGAVVLALLALFLPVLAIVAVIGLLLAGVVLLRRLGERGREGRGKPCPYGWWAKMKGVSRRRGGACPRPRHAA